MEINEDEIIKEGIAKGQCRPIGKKN